MPDNTAESWGAALLKLAEEAEHDAGEHDTALSLHVCLNDLAQVARAYAGRLDIEKGVTSSASPGVPPASEFAFAPFPTRADIEALVGRIERVESVPPLVSIVELPEWLLATLRDFNDRITALEARANFDTIAPSPLYDLATATVVDDDPSAWDSIDRARAALRGMVVREHRDRAAIRQKVLERVAALARQPDIATDSAAQAELRQHQARADELAEIDAIGAVKLDEIAGLDDLELARLYVAKVKQGWPQ